MVEIDNIIDGLERISLSAQLRDKMEIASNAARKRCGSCYFWVKSRDCPAEKNVNGQTRGPSCDGFPCHKFQMTRSAAALIIKRQTEANEFARQYGFDEPFSLSEAQEGRK